MIARCYLRVSTEDQAREGYSLPAQRDRLDAFARSQGWEVAEIYVDEGVSAKDMNRPALRRLLDECRRGEVVLVYRLDRLTRSVADLDALLGRWEAEGVLFRSATEDFNTTTAAGRLFIRLVADIAQWERENLAERTRMGMARRAQEGEWNGGPAPFGYTLSQGRLVPSEHAGVVRELFERYVAGEGMRQLARWLQEEKGIRSPRGGRFSDASVSGMLRNPAYCGLLAWGRGRAGPAGPLVEGRHRPLVPRALWEQAQRIREGRRRLPPRQATGPNILTGVGRCGLCGSPLKLNRSSPGHRYYRCSAYAARGACSLKGVPAGPAEAAFARAVCRLAPALLSPDLARCLAEDYLSETAQGPSAQEIRRQLAQARQALAAWDRALEEGHIGPDVWAQKTETHRARLNDLARLQAEAPPGGHLAEHVTALLADFGQIWAAARPEERKALAGAFFREVRLHPDGRVDLVPRLSGVTA